MSPPSPDFGILATVRHAPRLRLDRQAVYAQHRWMAPGLRGVAKGQRAMANWDEDVVTLAVEAGRRLLGACPATPAQLTLASTSAPFADRLNAGIVAAALRLPEQIAARDAGGSRRAGSTALLDALRTDDGASHLVLAAEMRTARPASTDEMLQGHGAAAVLVGRGQPLAHVLATHSVQADFVDQFRQAGEVYSYAWEERWVRDEGYLGVAVQAIEQCLAKSGLSAADVTRFAMPSPLPKVNALVAKRAGLSKAMLVDTAQDTVGDLGSAQALSMLDTALRDAQPGERVLLACFANGCDVLLLQRSAQACPGEGPEPGAVEANYLKFLSFSGQFAPEWGMRAEMDNRTALSAAWRDHRRTAGFEGGQCRHCGTLQFPAARLCVNPDCRAQDSLDPVSLADLPARVMSHTSDFLAYTPHPPFQFGQVDFQGGARVLMEFTDTAPGELSVGLPLRMVYRIKELDARRGFRRYFWKATPVRPTA